MESGNVNIRFPARSQQKENYCIIVKERTPSKIYAGKMQRISERGKASVFVRETNGIADRSFLRVDSAGDWPQITALCYCLYIPLLCLAIYGLSPNDSKLRISSLVS